MVFLQSSWSPRCLGSHSSWEESQEECGLPSSFGLSLCGRGQRSITDTRLLEIPHECIAPLSATCVSTFLRRCKTCRTTAECNEKGDSRVTDICDLHKPRARPHWSIRGSLAKPLRSNSDGMLDTEPQKAFDAWDPKAASEMALAEVLRQGAEVQHGQDAHRGAAALFQSKLRLRAGERSLGRQPWTSLSRA